MTPGKLTTEIVYTVRVTLISEERAISEETAKTKTRGWVDEQLAAALAKVTATTFEKAVRAAVAAGIGFTIQFSDHNDEVLTLTTFTDDEDERMLVIEGATSYQQALDRVVSVAEQHIADGGTGP